ncbi:MAG: bifunctional diaminohydroxyphosphoribosylaminopyrimidine deaminase/5-amino-6-(5-phosphoribosylamino)uracil reductase RibD, partial [Actinobacteria bacterium]|nr:bifunctional diaminohydroxyphosphoribosylaminopyrimidine deaminase/5-amino-6-(5-phosphoribosylamino)uracil reductase RibD [Actinomycetota bacterium]
ALEKAGIDTYVGVCEEEAGRLNESYVMHRLHDRPFVTLKAAITLDGRTAAKDSSSRWITGPTARKDVHRLRNSHDAICVGVGTVIADDPSLTVRDVRLKGRQPLRVVIDPTGRVPRTASVLSADAPTLVVTSTDISGASVNKIEKAGAEVLSLAGNRGSIDIASLLETLAQRDIMSLMLEGGAATAARFEEQGFIDKYVFYVAPKLLGGPGTRGLFEGWAASNIADAKRLQISSVKRLGEDIKIVAYPARVAD